MKIIRETLVYWLGKIELVDDLKEEIKMIDEIINTANEDVPKAVKIVECEYLQ